MIPPRTNTAHKRRNVENAADRQGRAGGRWENTSVRGETKTNGYSQDSTGEGATCIRCTESKHFFSSTFKQVDHGLGLGRGRLRHCEKSEERERETFLLIATPVPDKLPITFNFRSAEAEFCRTPSVIVSKQARKQPASFYIFECRTELAKATWLGSAECASFIASKSLACGAGKKWLGSKSSRSTK